MVKIPSVIVEIKPSRILKGEVGLFAVRNLKKGTIIAEDKQYKTKFFKWSEVKLDKITKLKVIDFCQLAKGGFYAPPNLNYLSIVWYMNHSCLPNVGLNDAGDFIAMKSIKKGDELVWDYSFGEIDSDVKMECHCGSKACRGIITGRDWRRPELIGKYFEYFMPNLKKEIKKMQKTHKSFV